MGWKEKLLGFVKNLWNKLVNLLTGFFKKIFETLKKVFDKLAQLLPSGVVEGMRTIAVKIGEAVKNRTITYTKDKVTGQYSETVMEKTSEEELPDWIKAKMAESNSNECETTEPLVLELETANVEYSHKLKYKSHYFFKFYEKDLHHDRQTRFYHFRWHGYYG